MLLGELVRLKGHIFVNGIHNLLSFLVLLWIPLVLYRIAIIFRYIGSYAVILLRLIKQDETYIENK